jgi:uncharacterized cupin superfamily protein
LSETEKPTAKHPFAIESLPWHDYGQGTRFAGRVRVLSDSRCEGGARIGVGIDELPPGCQSNQAHYHYAEEEHVWILEGRATLRLGDERIEMKAGDYVTFPAGQQAGHCLVNESDAVCRYVTVGERRNPLDVVVFTDTGKVSVYATGEIYDKSATKKYWDGEERGG